MICLCAIIESANRVAGLELKGLDHQTMEYVPCGNIAAAFTRHTVAPPAVAENIVQYEQAIESLMSHAALLPVRFGTCFKSEDGARDALNQNAALLAEGLEAVRGKVEMGVRILSPTPTARSSGTGFARGTDYMQAKLVERRQEEEREQQQLRSAQETLGPAIQRWPNYVQSTVRNGIASFAFLIPQKDVEAFRSAIRAAMPSHPDLRLLCTGPWPAYHFTPALSDSEACHA